MQIRFAESLAQLTARVLAYSCCWADTATCRAASFSFGSNAGGFSGFASATLMSGEFELNLSARPVGAVLNELDEEGLGIDTSTIAGGTDGGSTGDPRKFNLIGGTAPVSGQGESVTFSFDRSGTLESLLFDGIKDETLEYFSIEFPDSSIITLFDFEVELRLVQQSFQLAQLGVANPTLAADASDDLVGIDFAFQAGQQFRVTYGEIDYVTALPGYEPLGSQKLGNGARLAGIVVRLPEPTSATLTLFSALFLRAGTTSRNRCG